LLDDLFEQPGIKKRLPAPFSSLYVPVIPLPAALLGCRFEQPQMMPLFVAEREQTLELINTSNVPLQDPDDPGSSRGTKKSSP